MKAIYIRTSTEEQTPEIQLNGIRTIVKEECEIYEDKQSAWKDNIERKSFERLKKDISANKINEIYVWDWDRLYRNRSRLKEFFIFCKINKCQVHSFRQKFFEEFYKIPKPFDEIMQELFINLLGWMSEDESNKKSERVKMALRKKDGVRVSYKGNKWGRKELPKSLINSVLELYRTGYTIRKIAEALTYRTSSGNYKNISKSAVHKIISEFKGNKESIDDVQNRTNLKTKDKEVLNG